MFNVLYEQIMNTGWLEWSAIATTVICIILAGRNNIHTWWTGMVACALFFALFYDIKLYADAMLQVFFIGTSVVGWVGWKAAEGSASATQTVAWLATKLSFTGWAPTVATTAAPMRLAPSKLSMGAFLFVGVVAYAVYSMVLYRFTDAAVPFMDSAILVLSVIAQLWMMRRYVVSWPMWIAVNTIAVPLFYSRDLVLTSVVYAGFWLHAWYGWYNWYQVYKSEQSA